MSSTENPQLKKIDLENLIKSKNPKLLKVLPKFLINYLKRVIHQDEVNAFIEIHGSKLDFEFVKAVLEYFHINTETKGIENIPKQGGYIFAANHPLGGLDAMVFMHELGKVRRDIKFLVNDILMNLENLQNLFIPVNKHGANSLENLKRIDDVYASEQAVLIYPAGLVSRKQNGKIKDLAWKKSFITRAKKSKKNIIPVYIEGTNTNFFYNLANFRKNIGIKANIEMLYLVDEMYQRKNKTIRIIFGEPISFEIFDKSQTDNQWAQQVKSHVYSLGGRGNEFLPTMKTKN